MANFNPDDPASVAEFVLKHLPEHKQFALATADGEGNPWVVCLNMTLSGIDIIWKSLKNTGHSQHLAKRPEVSICVFSENVTRGDFGFYARAEAYAVTQSNELKRLLEIRYRNTGKPVPPLEEFLGEAPARLYRAEIQEAWVNDDRHIKTPVDLTILKRKLVV